MDSRSFEKATGTIADKYRLSILLELSKRDSLTPSNIQEMTGLSQSCVSHHMKLLTDNDLVTANKEGRNLYLSLNKDVISQLADFLTKLL